MNQKHIGKEYNLKMENISISWELLTILLSSRKFQL